MTTPHSRWFLIEADGLCRWTIRHQVTGELAGGIVRTPAGYALTDDRGRRIGAFSSLDVAVERLYEFA